MSLEKQIDWWDTLDHSGLLIAPARLVELDEKELPLISHFKLESLRSLISRSSDSSEASHNRVLDFVVADILRSNDFGHWLASSELTTDYSVKSVTGAVIRPRRVWVSGLGDRLPVFVDYEIRRIGIGKGVTFHARAIEWLRNQSVSIGLLFNGRELRLVHAGADYEAWCEWRLSNWFFAGEASPQLVGLQRILDFSNLSRDSENTVPLLIRLIKDSRKGQAEISQALGEQVRKAVELLIREFKELDNDAVFSEYSINNQALYVAANRLVMRIITVLFAEARDLLPLGNTVYFDSYALKGLREQLLRRSRGGSHALKDSHYAWPRILGLFRLLFNGSAHPELTTPEYFGDLFRPGAKKSGDIHLRALALFEASESGPSDSAVLAMLKLITSVKTSVKQRGGRKRVSIPVDFSDLSSEYIGILYEGLLDFELNRAPSDSPVVFLNIGNQPALPLARLEEMEDRQLKDLFEKLKKKSKDSDDEEAEEETEEQENNDEVNDDSSEVEDAIDVEESEGSVDDIRKQANDRAIAFAKKAVLAAGLVRRPRGANQNEAFEQNLLDQAKTLLRQVVLPNEWYLVRWGGTRKGGGTFYTRPQLALPTVRRTLEPLCYQTINEQKQIKKPEEILALKVCDPAMGSGSFLVGATKYLTRTLYDSLYHHGRVQNVAERAEVVFVDGDEKNQIKESFEIGKDDPLFEERLIARVKRHVVEHCIYGVDIDGLAVELAKLAFWVETMDRTLPFSFLDHRLKCGNALIGCNLVDFMHYPLEAWSRDLGDTKHTNGVHFEKEEFTKKKKEILSDKVKPELERWITELSQGRLRLADDQEDLRRSVNEVFRVYRQLAKLPINKTEKKRELYLKIQQDPRFVRLKQIMDAWCALWFWEPFEIETAPTPSQWPPRDSEILAIVDRIAKNPQLRFFHWELEFPDVFASTEGVDQRGFNAILGNPPWETLKPLSKEFFSNLDPLFRSYGKQPALAKQKELFSNLETERNWILYQSIFESYSNWISYCGSPEGKRVTKPIVLSRSKSVATALRQLWDTRLKRDSERLIFKHIFENQGKGENYTYRLFLEVTFRLLRNSGEMGLIVPAGVYSDKGSLELRELLLERCEWRWLFGFINWERIFQIYYRFKFCIVVAKKGGLTTNIETAFDKHNLFDWENAESVAIQFPRDRITKYSPNSKTILEIQSSKDLGVLEKIYSSSVLIGDDSANGWGLKYGTEFHMTNDSALFVARDRAEREGYRPNKYGMWINEASNVLLPLYEGRMVGQFDFSQKGWVSGKGRSAVWREIPFEDKKVEPQYLLPILNYRGSQPSANRPKVGFIGIVSATNARSMVASYIGLNPTLNVVPFYWVEGSFSYALKTLLKFVAVVNSFVFDWHFRKRLGAGVMFGNPHVLVENAIPKIVPEVVVKIAARLNMPNWQFAKELTSLGYQIDESAWGISKFERLRLRSILDAIMAAVYNLSFEDLLWILQDCDRPCSFISSKSNLRQLDPKGFWRAEKNQDPELRHAVLTIVAFEDLLRHIKIAEGDTSKGIDAFCNQNNGDGWMIPESICLADYNLGHDDRAKENQPVTSKLGPRFLDFQLGVNHEKFDSECGLHNLELEKLRNSLL